MYPLNSNSNILIGVRIANKDLFPSLMNIGFSVFLTKYKSTYFAGKDPKVLDILFISSLCFFEIIVHLKHFVKS